MKTLKEQIEVMTAEGEGKIILKSCITSLVYDWTDKGDEPYNWGENNYRVKPKPMERWINIYDRNGDEYIHETKKEAEKARLHKNIKVRTVKFIQAPDDEQ